MLTAVMKKKRLNFCQKYRHWTVAEWRKVMFSNESTFKLVRRVPKMMRRPSGASRLFRSCGRSNYPAPAGDLKALAPATVNIPSKEICLHARHCSRTSRASESVQYIKPSVLCNFLLVVWNRVFLPSSLPRR